MIESILIAVVAVVAAFFGGTWTGRAEQRAIERERTMKAAAEAERLRRARANKTTEAARESGGLDDSGVAERLRERWTRD